MSNKTSSGPGLWKQTPKFADIMNIAKGWSFSLFFPTSAKPQIDNIVLTLHAKVTVTLLTLCMGFVGYKQYFGEPIECLNTMSGLSANNQLSHVQLQHYCWMEGAFTVASRHSSDMGGPNDITGQDNSYPGIKNYKPGKGDQKVQHKYYQWVYYILCIQCLMFYAPKRIWRIRESGRLRNLIDKIAAKNVLQYSGLDRYEVVQDTLDVILTANMYFSWLIFAEVLLLINLFVQYFFLNAFLGGKFFLLGFEWIHYALHSDDTSRDPLVRLFPRLTKCSFHKFGVTGSIETYDTLCFMPLNIVNEKIFVFLWFWYIILFLVTLYHLFVYRAMFIMCRWVRKKVLSSLSPRTNKHFIHKMSKSPGKCFVLQTIAANMKPYAFRDLIEQVLADHFTGKMTVESRVTMKNFIVNGQVPESTLAPPKPAETSKPKKSKPPSPPASPPTDRYNPQPQNEPLDWGTTIFDGC